MSKTKRDTAGRAARLRPTTPDEACEILQSAIAYMQIAGFEVRAGNREGGLVIVVPGAEIDHGDAGTVIRPCRKEPEPDAAGAPRRGSA